MREIEQLRVKVDKVPCDITTGENSAKVRRVVSGDIVKATELLFLLYTILLRHRFCYYETIKTNSDKKMIGKFLT